MVASPSKPVSPGRKSSSMPSSPGRMSMKLCTPPNPVSPPHVFTPPTYGARSQSCFSLPDGNLRGSIRGSVRGSGGTRKSTRASVQSTMTAVRSERIRGTRGDIDRFLKGHVWEALVGVLSTLSFALLIVEADYGVDEGPPAWVRATIHLFSAFYATELGVRLFVARRKFFSSRLNVLDMCLVVADLVSFALEAAGVEFVVSSSVLRGLRALRLTRTLHASGKCSELHVMSRGLANAVLAAFFGAGLMLAVLAIFSATAVQVIHPINQRVAETGVYYNCSRCPHAFASVRSSLLTFFQQYVIGDSWGLMMLPIMEEAPITAIFFCVIFVSVHLTIMNVIMAVIVDIALKASQEDLAEKVRAKEEEYNQAAEELSEICALMDKDGSGDLTEEEIERGFDNNEAFREQLLAMDVKKEDMHVVFSIMDTDLSGTVNYDEFIQELFKMKQFDSHTMLLFIKHYVTEIRRDVHEQVLVLKQDIAKKIADVEQQIKADGLCCPSTRTIEDELEIQLDDGEQLQRITKLSTEFASLREHISQEIQQSMKEILPVMSREPSQLNGGPSAAPSERELASPGGNVVELWLPADAQSSWRGAGGPFARAPSSPQKGSSAAKPFAAQPTRPLQAVSARGGGSAPWPREGQPRSSWSVCCEPPARRKG